MKLQLKILTLNGRSVDEKRINSFLPDSFIFIFQFLASPENHVLFKKRRLTDVEEKVSTYLSIICIEDKKNTKLTSFTIMIFSTIIFSVQQFWWLSICLPLYPIVYCKSSKFCTNFDLFEFGKLRQCYSTIWNKNCFCSSSVVMLLLKDCIKATSLLHCYSCIIGNIQPTDYTQPLLKIL